MLTDEKVIFVPFIDAFGGVERLVLALSSYLQEHNHPHRVVCFSDTIDFASHADWPLKVDKIRALRNPLAESIALRRYLRGTGDKQSAMPLFFDLRAAFYAGLSSLSGFCLHLTDPPSLLPSDTSKMAFSARRNYAGFATEVGKGWRRALPAEVVHRINKRGVRSATSVVTMTRVISTELQSLYGVNLKVVRPGVKQKSKLVTPCVAGDNTLRILTVCRLEANKRIDWILRALANLEFSASPLSRGANWILEVVGAGSQADSLRSLSKELGLCQHTVFHGRLPDAKLEEVYSRASLFVMPAVQGYGLPALESLAMQIPVVIHKDSGVAEILGGSPWVEIIDNEVDGLAAAISTMIERIQSTVLQSTPLPAIPTESSWAQSICQICGWLDND